MPIQYPSDHPSNPCNIPPRNATWQQRTTRIDPNPNAKPTGWLCVENRAIPIMEIDLLEIVSGRGLHVRTRQESWLISLPVELQSDELLQAITSGEVNCLSGSCVLYESSSVSSNPSNSVGNNLKASVLEFE